MEKDSLVEKLTLQSESFQEGFEILCKSFTFDEMAKNFLHLLRGNFISTKIYLLYKATKDSDWKSIQSQEKFSDDDLSLLSLNNPTPIKYFRGEKYNAVVVLPLSDFSFLGILIGGKLGGGELNDFDKITLQILLQVFDSAHKSFINQKNEKKLIFELNEKVLQLNNLIDTGIELSKYENQKILFEIALGRIVILTNASSALIIISDVQNNIVENQITFPQNIWPESILSSPHKIDSFFEFDNMSYRIVLSEKETRGGTTAFNDLDEMLLQAVTRQVHASLENDFLLKQSLEKERIEKELNLAAAIQQKIIPEKLPKIAGYQLSGINIPSREVGGDYYDCFDLGEGKYALIMADVAGKGISAALLVSTLNAALHAYLEFNLPLTDLADKLNKLIYKASPPDKYITFSIIVLESDSGTLDILNAGHNPALLLRKDGTLEQIEAGGIGLGMLDLGIPYSGQTLSMNPGDKLFLYTDGIPEAMNSAEEEYSDERMISFLKENSGQLVDEFIKLIVEDVKGYAGEAEQSDDITSMILTRE
ncbi:MAG: serine/threonine-protein phosphatase [Ignavibacteriaceae bacterium]|nr:serine/threonine-protein phosphatase [Ignavibacteriaceae bacterium]